MIYRITNGFDHRAVKMAVVIQKMVPASVSGVLFTANPLTNRRQEAVIDAVPGLGEALVSGTVNPDHFVVDLRTMTITDQRVVIKQRMMSPSASGGTAWVSLLSSADSGAQACLTDSQILQLAALGLRVEAHFKVPQDIEWSLNLAVCRRESLSRSANLCYLGTYE